MIPHVSKQTNFEMTAVESSRGQNGDKKHLIANTRSDELSIISSPTAPKLRGCRSGMARAHHRR